jgi:hypothetical protein
MMPENTRPTLSKEYAVDTSQHVFTASKPASFFEKYNKALWIKIL